MPLAWDDLFFADQAELTFDLYEIPQEDRQAIREEWSREMFEIDMPVYKNGVKYILDGRKSALTALQKLCLKRVMELTGVRDRSREFAQKGRI